MNLFDFYSPIYGQAKVGDSLIVTYKYSMMHGFGKSGQTIRKKAVITQKTENLLILKSAKTGHFFSLGLYELIDKRGSVRTTVETA